MVPSVRAPIDHEGDAMTGGLSRILASRKAWAAAISSATFVAIQVVGFVGTVKGWDAATLQQWTGLINLSSGAVLAAGILLASLWAGESMARDWGVQDVTPEELRIRGAVLEELQRRLPPEALKLLGEISSRKRHQVD